MDSIPTLARNSQAENIVADRAAPKIPGHMHLTQSQRSAATASDGLNSASYFSTRAPSRTRFPDHFGWRSSSRTRPGLHGGNQGLWDRLWVVPAELSE